MAERLPYLALLFLTVTLIGYGYRHRLRQGLPCDRAFASKLVWASVGVATAIVASIWLFFSFTFYGGRIEDNMPPGYSPQFILGALLVGCAFTAISTAYGYVEHLDSGEQTSSRDGRLPQQLPEPPSE